MTSAWERQLEVIVADNRNGPKNTEHDPLVREFADLQRRLPRVCHAMEAVSAWHDEHRGELPFGFSVFYNRPSVVQSGAAVLIMGMNPGGSEHRNSLVSRNKNDWINAQWPAAQAWRHLFKGVFGDVWQLVLEMAPTTNFCHFRTPHEWMLPDPALAFSRDLWARHLLPELMPRRILICSKTAAGQLYQAVQSVYGGRTSLRTLPVGQHHGCVELWSHEAGGVVVAPHPSRWTVNDEATLAEMREALLG